MHARRSRLLGPRVLAGATLALAALALVLFRPAPIGAAARPYHVAARWTVGGEGGWDDLTADGASRRLFLTHNTQVEVLDLDSGKKLGVIPGASGAHGVAIASALGRGFITSGRDSALIVFDLKSLNVISRIKVPARFPDAVLF